MESETADYPQPIFAGQGRGKQPGWNRLRLAEPVIVLTCARSGSTLLRFILDAHPELACPSETGVVDMCTRMGVLSMLLDGPPTDLRPGLTGLGASAIRSWVATTFGTYLIRTGKSRWCDKSLGSAESANRFLDIFPQTKFICLYRNCLDLIDSALEACPFGLRGYGMDPFAAAHPGNTVGAVADYWVTHTRAIAQFEREHPEICLRVRYEDLVSDPDTEADRIFTFLGEPLAPDVAQSCLSADREQFGPSDHKIWSTTSITPESVGRGSRIPLQLISPPVLAMVNGLMGQLGYPLISTGGNDQSTPEDAEIQAGSLEIQTGSGEIPAEAVSSDDGAPLDELERLLTDRLSDQLPQPASREEAVSSFLITATLPRGGQALPLARWWRIDPQTLNLTRGGAHAPQIEPGEWAVTGEVRTWHSVLTGDLNLGTALRQGHIRYSNETDVQTDVPFALRRDPHTGVLARLLTAAREKG